MSNNVLVNTDIKPGESTESAPSTLIAGTDGDFVHNLRCDSDGILQVNLAVPTISVTGINASVGTVAATPPVFATQVGGTDGTVLRELHFIPPSGMASSTDPALIVTFSPNSPLPAGSNVIGTVTANLGTSGDLALDATLTDGTQKAQLTDGTNDVAVATGAAGAGSNALVVGLSPNSPLPAGSNALGSVTANIGTTNGLALDSTLIDGSQHTKISNGGIDAVVKAGSTAAAAGDGALVVTLSPNSPLPSGTNAIGTVTAVQSVAASLLSQVSQPTASALNATVVQAAAGNLNATAVQGTAAALSGAWPVKVTDGTNTQPTGDIAGRAIFHKVTDGTNTAAVKAASSSASVSDPALVVQISPNQDPIPVAVYPSGALTNVIVGRTAGTGSGSFTPINATPYTPPTGAAAIRSIVSSSASDTALGTGARQVEIQYYDISMNGPFTTTVTLNGTTAVATSVSNIYYIQRIGVISVGSTGANAGTITLGSTSVGGSAIWSIGRGNVAAGVGDNETIGGFFYVGTGRVASIWSVTTTAIPKSATISTVLRAKNPLVATSPEVFVGDHVITSSAFTVVRTHQVPITITGPAFVQAYGTVDTNQCDLYVGLDVSDSAA